MRVDDIRRIPLGTFLRPAQETGGEPQPGVVLGYALRLGRGVLLFDTGMGSDPEVDAWYRPRRTPLPQALRGAGLGVEDVDQVVNCHLHFDHCGGNPQLPGRPIWCQRRELEDAHAVDYTLPGLVDFPGARYELVDGDAEIAPGVWLLGTPGHVPGHQSLAVRCDDGTVVLAGQALDTASELDRAVRAATAASSGPREGSGPAWLGRVLALDPARVLFAHDETVWQPS